MLKQLIFMVSENIELPEYKESDVLVVRSDKKSDASMAARDIIKDTKRDTIYICDDSLVARKMQENGENVVALLTDDNSNQDFSFCSYAIMEAKECELAFFEGLLKLFLGLPFNILETQRCLVRETTLKDVDDFYILYKDKEITEYMEPLFEDRDEEIEYTKSYIKNIYEFYGFGMWTIVEKKSGKVIGRAGVSYREGFALAELGFMIGKEYQRKGFAYEVCKAICNYMYENYDMEELQILIEPQNTPSILLAKKLGASLYKKKCMGECDSYIMKLPLSDS